LVDRLVLLPGVELEHVRVDVRFSSQIVTELTASLLFAIGPARVRIDGLGVRFSLQPGSGNLGFAELAVSATPFRGAAVSVSAGVLVGGGTLTYEEDVGRGSGALVLAISEIVLRALGVLDLRSRGVPEYSFVVIISAEFTPLQIGFGFTLNGLGGLCGIQRSVNIESLQRSVRGGSLAPMLFPRDPVSQASRIVTAISAIFPATQDSYVFGPLFRLGWGTPTLVTITLGLVIRLPDPITIALIGQVEGFLSAQFIHW